MHLCPGCLTAMIAAEKYICNLCSARSPQTLIITCGTAFTTGGTVTAQTAALKALTDWLLANPA